MLAAKKESQVRKIKTQGGDKHEGMHFKYCDLAFRVLQHTFSKVSVIFLKNCLNTAEIVRNISLLVEVTPRSLTFSALLNSFSKK